MYILIILLFIISFTVIINFKKKKGRYKKSKPLSKMSKKEFKKTMKGLEIK